MELELSRATRRGGARHERRRAMTKTARLFTAVLLSVGFGTCLLMTISAARATTTTDRPAGILVWPRIVVNETTDTIIQISNTASGAADERKQAHCYLINANSHCSTDSGVVCRSADDCGGGGTCDPGWTETDFNILLTRDQPLGWRASTGLAGADVPLSTYGFCDSPPDRPCNDASVCSSACIKVPNNIGTAIPPVPEVPFLGALKCIEMIPGQTSVPDTSNTLEGEATIETREFVTDTSTAPSPAPSFPDLQKYNAVGLQACTGPNSCTGGGTQLIIGNTVAQQYQSCAKTLILNHLFDARPTGEVSAGLTTTLTLVPCTDDFLDQIPGTSVAQFLVFNEFEQRFSTSKSVDCFFESAISGIDTPDPTRSIFSILVQGTLAGQTRIRPIGSGLVGVASVALSSPSGVASAAYELHQSGNQDLPDKITIPKLTR